MKKNKRIRENKDRFRAKRRATARAAKRAGQWREKTGKKRVRGPRQTRGQRPPMMTAMRGALWNFFFGKKVKTEDKA